MQDLSHRAHEMHTTLSPAQEAIAVELRSTLLLPLDDLVTVVREFINPKVSRSGLDRCLHRHGVANLRELQASASVKTKTFKDYEPGFLHIDIKYLPQTPDETDRRYLFVANVRCKALSIEHRLCPPRHPQTICSGAEKLANQKT